MKIRNFINRLLSSYKNLDIFGYRVELFFENQSAIKSKVGATVSLIFFAVFFYLVMINIISWKNNAFLNTISSIQSYSIQEIAKSGENWNYTFDYNNYYPSFTLVAFFSDGSYRNHSFLEKYFMQSFIYYDNNSVGHMIEGEPCSKSKQSIFLEKNIEDNKTVTSLWCIKDPLEMGVFIEKTTGTIHTPTFDYIISKCVNTTENGNFCASEDDIAEMTRYTFVQVSLPKSVFDFSKANNPRKRTYDTQSYGLDNGMMKNYMSQLSPVFLKTDHGIFDEDYELDSVDFNLGKLSYQTKIRTTDFPVFLTYGVQFGFEQNTFYRRNLKLKEIMANIGGIMNILLLLGKAICYTYNSKLFHKKIINYSLSRLEYIQSRNKTTLN